MIKISISKLIITFLILFLVFTFPVFASSDPIFYTFNVGDELVISSEYYNDVGWVDFTFYEYDEDIRDNIISNINGSITAGRGYYHLTFYYKDLQELEGEPLVISFNDTVVGALGFFGSYFDSDWIEYFLGFRPPLLKEILEGEMVTMTMIQVVGGIIGLALMIFLIPLVVRLVRRLIFSLVH